MSWLISPVKPAPDVTLADALSATVGVSSQTVFGCVWLILTGRNVQSAWSQVSGQKRQEAWRGGATQTGTVVQTTVLACKAESVTKYFPCLYKLGYRWISNCLTGFPIQHCLEFLLFIRFSRASTV